jgi:hypothetical protein
MHRRPLALAAVLTLSLCVAGVVTAVTRSDGSTAPLGAATPTLPPDHYTSTKAVCALLTEPDLEAILGVAFADGDNPGITSTFGDIPGITKCRYTPEDQPTYKVESALFAGNAAATFDETKELRSRLEAEAVPGLGQEALWYPQAHELLVLAEGKVLGLSMSTDAAEPSADLKERARRLAIKAIARLR